MSRPKRTAYHALMVALDVALAMIQRGTAIKNQVAEAAANNGELTPEQRGFLRSRLEGSIDNMAEMRAEMDALDALGGIGDELPEPEPEPVEPDRLPPASAEGVEVSDPVPTAAASAETPAPNAEAPAGEAG